jgi:NTE family protein
VRIGGDRFVDGGVASMHNLDLLADRGLDLVIVSAPMSFAGIRPPLSPDVVLRQSVRLQLAGEIAKLRRRGTKVVVVAPTGRVVTAMGVDAMDARRRGAVSRAAHRTTLDVVARRRLRVLLADAAGAPRSAAGHHPAA